MFQQVFKGLIMSHHHFTLTPLLLALSTGMVAIGFSGMAHAETNDDIKALEFLPSDQIPANTPSNKETAAAIERQRSKPAAKAALSIEELKKDPQLFTIYMNQLIAARNYPEINKLLPIYKQLPQKDPLLIKFADALVYRSQGKHKSAISIYRGMLAEDPTFHPVRLNLAIALMDDKQYSAAQEQLTRLKGEDLPDPVMQTIDNTLMRIKKSEKFSFHLSGNYTQNNNVNDAPSKQYTSSLGKTQEAKVAHGVQLNAGVSKRKNLPNNLYAQFNLNAYGTYYWDETDYNDYSISARLPIGYENATISTSVSPFVSKRIYSDKAYNTRAGVGFAGSKWVKPKLRVTASSQLSFTKHDEDKNKNRDARDVYLGLNGLYIQGSDQYFFGGINHYSSYAEKSSIVSYDRQSVNLGWGKEWYKGISSKINSSYAYKKYDDPARTLGSTNFYYKSFDGKPGSSRIDQTASVDLQLWKRNFTLLGLTPRVVLEYSNTQSNFGYYDDRQNATGTVVLTKTF